MVGVALCTAGGSGGSSSPWEGVCNEELECKERECSLSAGSGELIIPRVVLAIGQKVSECFFYLSDRFKLYSFIFVYWE